MERYPSDPGTPRRHRLTRIGLLGPLAILLSLAVAERGNSDPEIEQGSAEEPSDAVVRLENANIQVEVAETPGALRLSVAKPLTLGSVSIRHWTTGGAGNLPAPVEAALTLDNEERQVFSVPGSLTQGTEYLSFAVFATHLSTDDLPYTASTRTFFLKSNNGEIEELTWDQWMCESGRANCYIEDGQEVIEFTQHSKEAAP